MPRDWFLRLIIAAAAIMLVMLLADAARSHTSPWGMVYPTDCCNQKECAPIRDDYVKIEQDGIRVTLPEGAHPVARSAMSRLFPWGHRGIRYASDGHYHACASYSIHCIIIPPPGS